MRVVMLESVDRLCFLVGAALFMASAPLSAQTVHAHGAAELNIVVEGAKAIVELIAPASGIYGFEHEARNAAERDARDAGLARLRTTIHRIVVFDAKLGCRFSSRAGTVVKKERHAGRHSHGSTESAPTERTNGRRVSGEHSEVRAEFDVACARPLAGTSVRFGVTRAFPALQALEVQVLSGTRQLGRRIIGDRGSVQL